MELQQLRYAVAIAEEQSFTRAAQRCFVVQSALSRQIKSLESELGVRLFARTSRKVEVTPAGEAFVKQARLCLQAAERAKASAAAACGEIRGSLTIGVIPTVTAVDVAAVLGAFRRSYPEVGVHVRTGGSDEFLRRIAAGQLDVGVLGLAEGVTPRGVQTRELSQERLVAVLSEGHRLAGRRRLRLKDLADEPFVDFPEGSSGREQSDLAFERARLRREVSLEVNTADLLTGLVRQGLGVALVAPSVARQAPGCVCIPVSDSPVRVEYLAWDSFNPSPAAQAFVDSILMPTGQRPLSLTATTA
ncbi:LysR family transcriptional regulator [Actinomyces oris]|uniref:LysR family transcriptional regulator n=1 Tax=Actinomyces oris TaxID=544580 RepID=UPI00288B2DEE|nr:LysR family transcriptional regulator [Actinomyces oris]